MRFVLASNNKGKLREMKELLGDLGIEILSQKEAGLDIEVEENGSTFRENAMIKARAACEALGIPAIADDSGLCVDALNGEPGIYSARYGGEGLDDKEKYRLLLKNMEGKSDRNAQFVCAIVCVMPDGEVIDAWGECPGEILYAPQGDGGFGYDPVFYVPEFARSMAELSMSEKNSISHRGKALREFKIKLEKYFEENNYADR